MPAQYFNHRPPHPVSAITAREIVRLSKDDPDKLPWYISLNRDAYKPVLGPDEVRFVWAGQLVVCPIHCSVGGDYWLVDEHGKKIEVMPDLVFKMLFTAAPSDWQDTCYPEEKAYRLQQQAEAAVPAPQSL